MSDSDPKFYDLVQPGEGTVRSCHERGADSRSFRFRPRIVHKLTSILFLFAFLASGLLFLVLYRTASDQVLSDVRQRIRDVVSIATRSIDPQVYARLVENGREDSIEYQTVYKALQSVRDMSSDIRNIYTMGMDEQGRIVFMVDAENNPAQFAHMNQVYSDASEMLRQNFASMAGPMVENAFYMDQWGSWLSGYAPFYYRDGTQRGILGVDIPVATVNAYKHRLLLKSLGVFGFVLPVVLLVGLLSGRKIAAPVLCMGRWARAIGRGELHARLDIQRKDEVGILAADLNEMALNLSRNQVRLQELAAKYRNIFDNAAEGFFQGFPEGRIVTANPAMSRILGYDDSEQLVREIDNFLVQICAEPEDRRRFLDSIEADGRVDALRMPFLRRDETRVWVEISAHKPPQSNDSPLVEGMVVDITQRMEREQADRERRAAEAASKAKSEFLANMSHEIRTPLNAVTGLADLLGRTELGERQREYLRKIKISSQSLLAVINDILDFSKIEAGRLELEETDFSLYEVLANLSEIFAFKANEKDIEFVVSIAEKTPCGLRGDPVRLGQVLINLVGNAVKFTSRGEVVVRVGQAAEQPLDGRVSIEFSVTDSGIGIDPARLATVFESFTQADNSTTRQYGGTGLGLAICRQLVALMDGEIHAGSTPGKGSCFSFTALFTPQPPERQISLRPPKDLRGLSVLVVDDNKTARDILISFFHSFQMAAQPASSGEEALDIIERTDSPFDLILLDWKMPGLNGIETARRIKRNGSAAPIICMISAYGREDLLQQSDKTLLDAFLRKPVNPSLLFDTIMGLFGRKAETAGESLLPADSSMPTIPAHLSGARVLLVEDNEINQEVAREWLESAGMLVTAAGNGRVALETLERECPDIVLMDIQMPELDGVETTRRLRAQERFKDLPIIAMTAHALKGDRELCLEAGMNDYVTKPIDPCILFAALGHWTPKTERPQMRAPAPVIVVREPEESLPAALPGISIVDGLFRVNQNRRLYLRLLRSFARDFAGTSKELVGCLERGMHDDAGRLAHSVKGVAGNLGAKELSVRAAAAEHLLATGTAEQSSAVLLDFIQTLEEVLDGLRQNLQRSTAADKTTDRMSNDSMGPTLTAPMLLEVADLLNEDLGAALIRIEELTPALRALSGDAAWASFQDHLEGFQIDEAIDFLRGHAKSLQSGRNDGDHRE